MRKYVLPLIAANLVAFAAIGASYFVYSRLLTPAAFGVYSMALAVGTFAVLVLDGGVKTIVIKSPSDPSAEESGSLLIAMIGIAVSLIALTAAGIWGVSHFTTSAAPIGLSLAFAIIYLATYPWISLSTALLERSLDYARLAWVESIGTLLERGSPALLLLTTDLGLNAFAVGLLGGRLFRLAALQRLRPLPFRTSRRGFASVKRTYVEGLWFQLASAASFVRDNLHVLLVGPLFGAAWVGYYTWALQLCTIASQLFVQIAARIALPLAARAADARERLELIGVQVRTLAAVTALTMASAVPVAIHANAAWFQHQWDFALPLVLLLGLRMIPGVACSPIGPLLIVERGTRVYAGAVWIWTGVEVGLALGALLVAGPQGLGWSYAAAAWIGIAIMMATAFPADARLSFRRIVAAIFAPRSVTIAVAFGAVVWALRNDIPLDRSIGTVAASLVALIAVALCADRFLRALISGNR